MYGHERDAGGVGDITFVPLAGSRFAYLALLINLYSRRIVGWQLAEHMTEALLLAALREKIRRRQPSPGFIHHRDRGGQYAGGSPDQAQSRPFSDQVKGWAPFWADTLWEDLGHDPWPRPHPP